MRRSNLAVAVGHHPTYQPKPKPAPVVVRIQVPVEPEPFLPLSRRPEVLEQFPVQDRWMVAVFGLDG